MKYIDYDLLNLINIDLISLLPYFKTQLTFLMIYGHFSNLKFLFYEMIC